MNESALLRDQFSSANPPRSMFPLLWLHGDESETEEVLRRELKAMDDIGCGGFVIESRPHNDYLGERWWRDVGICLDEAQQRGMEVWIFDEEYYPSGIAGGKVLENMPDYRMLVLTKDTFEWSKTLTTLESYEPQFQEILKIICVNQASGAKVTLLTIEQLKAFATEQVASNSSWTIHIIGLKPSWSGRMFDKMVDYLCPEVTDCFISLTYETTKRHFPQYWGSTIKGFFGDETSFENFGSYDVLFGEDTPSFPWSRVLLDTFIAAKGYNLLDVIEVLWFEEGENTASIRVDFMDHITRLFSDNFFKRIQQWCQHNGVKFIGHIVEDNHAHMHHGYGVGHFFRATEHFDMGGYDFVLRQFDSEQKKVPYEEHFPQFGGYRNEPYPDFFQYTLAKLAQSAAHLEVGTSLVMCENFGAYGWDIGLREMKWLTDWMTARGTNWYVPHAFSPIYPDPDCPPHFYAGGNNPQWPYFRQWGDYANRSCLMLQGASHIASVAVLYPAEAHWAGDQDELDQVCKMLMQNQYDFDIVSMDLLVDEQRCHMDEGVLRIRDEEFKAIVLPNISSLPVQVVAVLHAFVASGGIVLSVGANTGIGDYVSTQGFIKALSNHVAPGIHAAVTFPELRYCHYRKEGLDIFFLNNESVHEAFEGVITFPVDGTPERWTPMDGRMETMPIYDIGESGVQAPVRLEPYEAVFIVIDRSNASSAACSMSEIDKADWYQVARTDEGEVIVTSPGAVLQIDEWNVIAIESPLQTQAIPEPFVVPSIGDWHQSKGMEAFSGSVTYEAVIQLGTDKASYRLDLGEVGEIAEVEINGHPLIPRLCPPYRWELPAHLMKSEQKVIRVKVSNTLGPQFREDQFRRDVLSPSGLLGPATLTELEHHMKKG
jgi:hypothetical protein